MTLKQLCAALETEDLLKHVLDGRARRIVSFALLVVQTYLYAAQVQQRRIVMAARRLDRLHDPQFRDDDRGSRRLRSNAAMAAESHFYITCWGVIGQHLGLIRSTTRFAPVGRALRPYNQIFLDYRAMRDRLEHFDDQLLDSPRARPRRIPQDLGNFSKATFSFGGETVDIGPRSLHQLQTAVGNVESALKTHAWQMITESQPDVAERIVERVVRERHVRKIIRAHRL